MNRVLRVTFVMARTGEWPSGGNRIIYEFANHLSRRGHTVTVVAPGRLVINPSGVDYKIVVRFALRNLDRCYTPDKWLKMDPKTTLRACPLLRSGLYPTGM